MDDISVKKKQIEEKLNQEKMTLSFLKESLTKSDHITKNMLNILASFESRIHKLEDTIVPVHKETVDLQRRQSNIDRSLSALDHVISYHHVYSNTEHVIRDAPTGNLEAYIKNLERVIDAIEFFTQNNPNCLEMTHLTSLRECGRESLEKEFRMLLNRHSKPVPGNVILDCIGNEEGQLGEELNVEHLPEKVIEDLSTISNWLTGPGKTHSLDFMSAYAQIRSSTLVRSMQGIKEIRIMDSTHSSGKFKASSGVSTPTRKGISKKKDLRRVPSKPMEFSRKGSSLQTSLAFDSKDGKEEHKDEKSDIDASGYVLSCKALLKLIESERELMKPVIPEEHQNAIFDKLIEAATDAFMAEGETIISTLKRFITKHNYSAIMQTFPILKQFRQIQPHFDDIVQDTTAKTRMRFPNLIRILELTSSRALEEFADGIKHGPDKHSNMPKDGTVHELTRNTLIFMDQLLPYSETVGHVLATQQEDQMRGFINRDKGQLTRITAEYVQRVLGSLGLNLQLKAKVYESVTLSSLFLLNNYHYILKALQRSGLLELLKEGEITDIDDQYQMLVEEQKNMYDKCWSKVLHYLLEMDKPGPAPKGADAKLKDKQRQMIKDKFKGFNTEFDEIYQIQKTYTVPDDQLREEIRKKNFDLIVPLYRSFREKYEGVQFTKNPEKYVKYSPDEVGKLIKKFFDVSA
ncbi:exocyst complex component 7-like [Actinia tenebrosa]|uniref:Exocyst complex component 7 n=1 Tax=Actinia tenebrosa TaxID=6105 RepID=A0A6P8IK38_ACTTE|nr:exocyst complex component 7-like [Actinia tenebrosa]